VLVTRADAFRKPASSIASYRLTQPRSRGTSAGKNAPGAGANHWGRPGYVGGCHLVRAYVGFSSYSSNRLPIACRKRHRTLINPSFHFNRLKGMVPLMAQAAATFTDSALSAAKVVALF
jgi:hypothetical protein